MIRKAAFFVFFFFISIAVYAQSGYSLKVRLVDSLTREPVVSATISLSKSDTTDKGAYYSTVNEKGNGIISKIPNKGKYYFKATMLGYKDVRRVVELKGIMTDLGEILMQEDISMMQSAVVSAIGNTMVVKKDTIEYNVALFKISDNDMLEDLLKKLPGVEVDKAGKITAHGEEVKKIMVQGKEFFLDDPKLASKNIPANVVQTVKVLEQKSKQAEFTGIDDGQEQTIIDLMVRPGMMNTWFGNIVGGGGMDMAGKNPDGRYQASGIVGHFSEKLQVSFLANGNNTNNRGFDDMAGEMGGGGMRGMGRFSGGGGIMTSWMGGANVNYSFAKDRNLGGDYLYNGSVRDVKENSKRTTFINDTQSLITDKSKGNHYFSDGHRVGAILDYKFNDNTSVYFRSGFNYGNNHSDEKNNYSTENTVMGKVNDGQSNTSGNGYSWSTNGHILLRHKIGKKQGRTISIDGSYSLANSSISGINRSVTNIYRNNILRDSSVVDQYYNQKSDRYSLTGNVTYTEPLGMNFFLLSSYQLQWDRNLSEKLTYDGKTDILDSVYSNNMRNNYLNHTMQVSMMKQEEKYNLQIGFNAQPFTTGTKSEIGVVRDTSFTMWNFAPSARFDYRFSKNEHLRINYNGRTSQPSIDQLMPAPNNSDPLYVALGNPSLKPQFRHNMRVNYRCTDMKSFSTYSVGGSINYTKDNITNAKWYDGSGVQYSVPINAKGPSIGANVSFMFNLQVKKTGFSIMSSTRSSVSSSLTYTGEDTSAHSFDEIKENLLASRTTSLNVNENLSFVYRNDFLETRLGARVNYKNAWYEISSQKNAETWNNNIFGEITADLPWGMTIRSDIDYNFFVGYDKGFGEPVCTWNAEISQLFFKKRMTLRFKVYDILNQAKNNFMTTTENYVEEKYNNTLGQYFILCLTYRFGNSENGHGRGRGRGHGYGRGH